MNNTKSALIITLFSCMGQGTNHYTAVSVNKILELLELYHSIVVKRRWLFTCLRDLLDSNIITRRSRFSNEENGVIFQLPSMISFTLKGAKYLVSKRVSGSLRLLKAILNFIKCGDRRWPQPVDIIKPKENGNIKDDKRRLANILGSIVKGLD